MTAPAPKKQKAGWSKLDGIFTDASNVWVIHYSCESFYDRPNGASPRITSLAVRKLDSGQTISFSIHQVAETEGIEFSQIDEHYDDLERKMLALFYEHVAGHKGMRYLHWNMRDVNYGFAAIEHRYRVLGGSPIILEDERKVDLARLLIDIYGVAYTGHPRLQTLLAKNDIKPRARLPRMRGTSACIPGPNVGSIGNSLRRSARRTSNPIRFFQAVAARSEPTST